MSMTMKEAAEIVIAPPNQPTEGHAYAEEIRQ